MQESLNPLGNGPGFLFLIQIYLSCFEIFKRGYLSKGNKSWASMSVGTKDEEKTADRG